MEKKQFDEFEKLKEKMSQPIELIKFQLRFFFFIYMLESSQIIKLKNIKTKRNYSASLKELLKLIMFEKS